MDGTLNEQPGLEAAQRAFPEIPVLGMLGPGVRAAFTASDLNPGVASELGLKEDARGVVIANVVPDSVADSAGLRAGDVILAVEREDVRNAGDAARKMRAHAKDGVLLRIRREGASHWLRLPAAG